MNGIILMGPDKVGKRDVGRLLAERMELPFHDLGEDTGRFRKMTDFDPAERVRLYLESGYTAIWRYMLPIRAEIVERALAEYKSGVVVGGEMLFISDNDVITARLQNAMGDFGRRILLLPHADSDKSYEILEQRNQIIYHGMDWNDYFARHPNNRALAKHVIYNENRLPADSAAEIVSKLDRSSKQIFLIGPIGTGKTTTGKQLADLLDLPRLSMDGIRRKYYAEVGYSEKEEHQIGQELGFPAVLDYWKKFDLHSIKRMLEDYPDTIVDFGAGQTIFEDEQDAAELAKIMEPFPNVFLLMPSPDMQESLDILQARVTGRMSVNGVPVRKHLIDVAYRSVRPEIIYTESKSVEQLCDEILGK